MKTVRLFPSLAVLPVLLTVGILTAPAAQAQITLQVTRDKDSPVYDTGETVTWNLKVTGDGADAIQGIDYDVKRDLGTKITSGTLPVTADAAQLTAKLDQPGTLVADFGFTDAAGRTVRKTVGVVVDPDHIPASAPEPDDFEAFWNSKVDELDKVPINPVVTPMPSDVDGVDYAQVTLDNIRGTHLHAQIARPTAGDKFPAILLLQYAGVYALPKAWVTNQARRGWLAMDVNAHDLPIDQPDQFYKDQAAGPLANYVAIGDTGRETSYFLRMALGTRRAVEYLQSRPDWNGQVLVASGTSQGGLQSLMAAALSPAVTQVMVDVPAGCDATGPQIGRSVPWPYWYANAKGNAAVMTTSRYYDGVNFARHVKVPTLVGVGLIDLTATAPGVIAMFNQIQSPAKKLVILEFSDHHGTGGAQAPFYRAQGEWMEALAKNEPLPGN